MSGNITMTLKQKNELERKAKAGWRCYYSVLDDLSDAHERLYDYVRRNRELVERLKNNTGEEDLSFLKSQFIEMYDEIKKTSECPVCFTLITKDNINVPSCGHILCKGCKDEVMTRDKKCPCCRKTFYG